MLRRARPGPGERTPMHIFHALATFAAGLFAGATFYVSAVAQPIRLELGATLALPTYRASLLRSRRLNPVLHVTSLLATVVACIGGGLSAERVAALLFLAPILPLTLIAIRPLNSALLDPSCTDPERAMDLLRRWGRLHAARTALGMAAFLAPTLGI